MITDIAVKPVLLQSTSNPFANMDLALSREFNRKGQRKEQYNSIGYEMKISNQHKCVG